METEQTINYKGYPIFLNKWDEYCVLKANDVGMICYNSGFDTLKKAKEFINKIYLRSYQQNTLEDIAKKIK